MHTGTFDYYRPTVRLECPVCHVSLSEWFGESGPSIWLVWQQGVSAPIDQLVDVGCRIPLDRREQLRLPPNFKIYSYDCEIHCVRAECGAPGGVWAEVHIVDSVDLRAGLHQRDEEPIGVQPTDPKVIAEWIDNLVMEVNSGASFEQYFEWIPTEQLTHIVNLLEQVGLTEVAELTREAIRVAFPGGLPTSDFEKDTQRESLNGNQIERMHELAEKFIEHNALIEKVVDYYAHQTGA